MNITRTSGCTAYSFRVDGKSIDKLNQEELVSLFDRLVVKIRDNGISSDVIEILCEELPHSDYTMTSESCESCGDYVETTTWKL
jgi:hypothetical protein